MIRAGALDQLGANRATLIASLDKAMQMADQHNKNENAGFADMFGFAAPQQEQSSTTLDYLLEPDWTDKVRLQGEKETLGLYLTGHPIERYEPELKHFVSTRLKDLKPDRKQMVVVAGLVVGLRLVNTKRGDKLAIVTLDDRTGRVDTAIYPEAYQKYRVLIVKDKLLVVEGSVSVDDFSGGFKMSCEHLFDIDQARERFAKRLEIKIGGDRIDNGFVDELSSVLTPFRDGAMPVLLHYRGDTAQGKISLGNEWRVSPTDELIYRLEALAGKERVRVVYG